MQKSFLFFRKSIDDRSPLAEYVDTYDDPNGSKSRFIQTQVAQGRSTWAQVFDAYVQSGYYSKFIRDISRIFSPEEIQQINRNIRQNHIDNASAGNSPTATLLRGASLSDDGNEIDLTEESRQMLSQQEPSLRRLLVGNHGIYAESSSPNAGRMIRVAPQGQYEHWQNGDRKYYKQLRGVNYADYRPGMWYAALGDYNLEPQRITLRQLIDSQNTFMSDEFLQHLDEEDTDYPFEDHTDAPVKVQGILSNFSPQDGGLIVNGKRYKTPEHLYQSLKFTDPSHRQQIVNADNAREAKQISRQLSTSPEGNSFRRNWYDIQDYIMRWVVSQRMEQQPLFRQALLATGDRPIIEHEGFRSSTRWGTRLEFTPDGQSFRGQNIMGKILMSVRDQYRAQAERDRSEDSPPTSSPAPPSQISPPSNTGAPVIQQSQSQTPASFSIADVPPQRSRPKSSNIEELAEIVHPASEDEDHEAMRRQSRIIIAGPRTSTLAPNGDASKGELAGQALAVWLGRSLFPEHFGKDLSVISGGAYGSDQSGEILAELLGIPALAMPARWNEVGAAHSQGNSRVAGPVRNAAMANRATGAIITLPSWHDIKFKVINNGGNAAIKIDPSIFGTSPTRNVTFSLSSENSLQNIIDLLKGDTSDEKKDLFRETFGVEIPNGLKEEDIKEAMMLAISRGNVDLPDSIKDSDLYKEAMGKWDGQPDTDEEMENIHQSRSTGSISMSQTAENRKLPTIRVFRSHSRGGGKIREITVSPPTTALRVAVPQFVLYSSDDPEKAQEDAERLEAHLRMSGGTFRVPDQDEIQGRLERISSFFNGRGTDLFGRKDATQLSEYKRVADHSYWSPSKEQIDEIEAHELTHMIDEHGLDTIPGMAAPVKIPRGAVPVIHGKQSRSRGSVSESFTSGSPPQTYLSMGRSSRIPPEKLSIIPAVAREAVFGNGEIHPKTIVDRVRPRLQMSYKSKIFPFALWPIR